MKMFAKYLLCLWTLTLAGTVCAETFQVSDAAAFKAALTKANGATDDVIEIMAHFALTDNFQIKKYSCTIRSGAGGPYTITTGSYVITLGKDNNNAATIALEDVVFSGGTASTFSLTTGGSLTLGKGAVLRDYTLNAEKAAPVYVTGGSFTMLSGSQIANIVNESTKSLSSAIYGDKGAVNLLGGTISGCSSVKSGGAAVYLTSNISTFTIGGDFTAINNTASGNSANVSVASATQMKLVAPMTGQVGIAYPATPAEGSAFGVIGEGYTATSADAVHFQCDTTDLPYVGSFSEGKLVWRAKCVGYDGDQLKEVLMAEAVAQGKPTEAVSIATIEPQDFTHAWIAEQDEELGPVVHSSPTLTESAEQVMLDIALAAPGRVSFSGAVVADAASDCRLDLYFIKDGVTTHVDELVGNHATWERADAIVSGAGTLRVVFTGDSELRSATAYLRNLLFTPSDGSAANPYPVTSVADAEAYCTQAASGATVHLTLEADVTGDLVVPEGVNVVIDLNGHTLTGGISGGGDITVDDSSDAGRGSVTGTVVATGTLTINAGVYSFDPTANVGLGCLVEAASGTWLVSAPISVDSRDHTLDTRPGVRVVSTQSDVLPITYSGTEWIDLTTTKGSAFVAQTPSYESEGPDYRTYENNLTDKGADAYLYSVPKSSVHNPDDIYTVQDYAAMGDGTLEDEITWDTTGKAGLWRLRHVVNGETLIADFLFPSREIVVEKSWANGIAYRSIEVTLHANGTPVARDDNPVQLTPANGWSYTFDRLPPTDAAGVSYVYTVVETALPGYVTTYGDGADDDPRTILNTRIAIAPPLNDTYENAEPTLSGNGWTVVDDSGHPWLTVADPLDAEGGNQVVKASCYSEPLTFTVVGDGEFSWSQLFQNVKEGQTTGTVTVTVDGETVYTWTPGVDDAAWEDYVIHVCDKSGHDQATHTIAIACSGDDVMDYFVDNVTWQSAATQVQMKDLVSVPQNAVSALLPSVKSTTSVANELNSGWMPVETTDGSGHITGVRSSDGSLPVDENGDYVNGPYVSTFAVTVEGPGTLDVGSLSLTDTDVDNGVLTVYVDGKLVETFDADRDPSSWNVVLAGEAGVTHVIEFRYEREARDPQENSSAVISNISWTPTDMPPADEGGVSWMEDEGKALMIVDHEDPGLGYCYLAFNPQLKYPELLAEWVKRTACPGKIKAKVGLTRAEMEACEPIDCTLREWDSVEVDEQRVWVKVQLPANVSTSAGYWRIWVEGSVIPYDTLSGYQVTAASDTVTLQGAKSLNVFGIIKVESKTANTIVAIPWTWYSALEKDATQIPAAKLVKTTNLTVGDMLYASTANGAYSAWTVVKDARGLLVWEAINVVVQDANPFDAGFHFTASGSHPALTMARGRGMWLSRQNPVDADGNAVPFWLYGQSILADVTNTVPGGTSAEPAYTMLANPFCTPVALNDLAFEGTIGSTDRIIVPNGEDGSKYVQWSEKRGWYWVEATVVNGRFKNVYHTDVSIPAGTGFWYVRRAADALTVKWLLPQ